MKTIGMIGGMSWESTLTYYQILNSVIKEKLGGLHSAKCILYSVDFAEIEQYQSCGDWAKSAEILTAIAQRLEKAGADFIIICTNTMHKVADEIQSRIHVPLLHIAEAAAAKLLADGLRKVALLGTRYTMEQAFYKDVLVRQGIEVLIPGEADRSIVNHVIYDELCLGSIKPESKKEFLRIIDSLQASGAQAVILGCTEIGLLVHQSDTNVPLYDTTVIHATEAAEYALR